MFQRRVKRFFQGSEAKPVSVVGDAMIQSAGVADGRFIPVLILDTRERPDVGELIVLHKDGGMGDVDTTWMSVEGSSPVCLLLEFRAPMEAKLIIKFDLEKQYAVVDAVLQAGGCYLQGGKPGDRLASTFGAPNISVEVNATGFGRVWNELLRKTLVKRFRREGFNLKTSRELAERVIAEMRKVGAVRLFAHRQPLRSSPQV